MCFKTRRASTRDFTVYESEYPTMNFWIDDIIIYSGTKETLNHKRKKNQRNLDILRILICLQALTEWV